MIRPDWFRRRRRLWSLVVILGAVSAIFLMFQMFSMEMLGIQTEKAAKHKIAEHLQLQAEEMKEINKRLAESDTQDIPSENSPVKKSVIIFKDPAERNKFEMDKIHLGENMKAVTHGSNVQKKNCSIPGECPDAGTMQEKPHKANVPRDIADTQIRKNEVDIVRTVKNSPVAKVMPLLDADSLKVVDQGVAPTGNEEQRPDGKVLGIHPNKQNLYMADEDGMFTCVTTGERIPFWKVNDDFCDCADDSDEPGTSACTDGRFYCTFQLSPSDLISIPSSKVHDGICDCCDGSDELGGPQLPDHVKLDSNQKYYGKYQAPCQDRCDEMRQEKLAKEEMFHQGAKIRQSYLKAGEAVAKDNKHFGPDGVFVLLSRSCYSTPADKYTYHVCPFTKAEQEFQGKKTDIGYEATWVSHSLEEGYHLRLGRGDTKGCPRSRARVTNIHFECGLEDKLLSIEEDEACIYLAKMSTPAACG